MGAYQVNLAPNVVVALGAVYSLPSGHFVRVLNQNNIGWYVEAVTPHDCTALQAGAMSLTGYFIWAYGKLCWTAEQWQGRVDRVAAEVEAVRVMRENRALAADQDVTRARQIDADFAAKKIAEAQERTANRKLLQMAA